MKYIKLTSLLILCTCSLAYSQCAKLDSLYRTLRVVKTPKDSINTLNALGEVYIEIGKEGQASLVVSKSLQMAEKHRYDKGIADALSHIAILDYKDLKAFGRSIEKYQKALKIYEELGDEPKMIQMLETLGAYFAKFPDQPNRLKALSHYEQASVIRDQMPPQMKTAQLHENIGWVYSQLEKDKEAIQAFQKAESLRQELGMRDPANARILAKYQRISAIEERIQHTDTFLLVTIFGIIIAIMAVITFICLHRQGRAYRLIKELQKRKKKVEV